MKTENYGMGRYRRGRSLHWMTQPRSLNGRFASSGGSNDPDPLGEWFNKQKWWVKILVVVIAGVLMALLWISGYMLVTLLLLWGLLFILKLIRAFWEG